MGPRFPSFLALNMHLEHYLVMLQDLWVMGSYQYWRGPPICAIHDILKEYCNEFLNDNMLKKCSTLPSPTHSEQIPSRVVGVQANSDPFQVKKSKLRLFAIPTHFKQNLSIFQVNFF